MVDDADLKVLDQDDDAGSGVGSADADGVEPAAVAQGDLAGLVDAIEADPVVGVGITGAARSGLGHGLVESRGDGAVRRPLVKR